MDLECDECGQDFANRFNLRRHMQNLHNEETSDDDDGDEEGSNGTEAQSSKAT